MSSDKIIPLTPGLNIQVGVDDDRILIMFDRNVRRVPLSINEALSVADSLVKHSIRLRDKLRGKTPPTSEVN